MHGHRETTPVLKSYRIYYRSVDCGVLHVLFRCDRCSASRVHIRNLDIRRGDWWDSVENSCRV